MPLCLTVQNAQTLLFVIGLSDQSATYQLNKKGCIPIIPLSVPGSYYSSCSRTAEFFQHTQMELRRLRFSVLHNKIKDSQITCL